MCTALEGVLAAPHEGSQRFLTSAGLRGDRGCPCPLGSSLTALGHRGREEGWAWMECAMLVPAVMSGQCSSKGETFCTEGRLKMDMKAGFPSRNTSLVFRYPGIPACYPGSPALLTAHFSLALVQHEGGPFPPGDTALFPVPCRTARRVQTGTSNMALPCSQGAQHTERPTTTTPLPCQVFGAGDLWGQQLSSATFIQGCWSQEHHAEMHHCLPPQCQVALIQG